jgi:hypothetical protein
VARARTTIKITDRDRGFARLVRNIQSAQRGSLSIGIQPKDAARVYSSGATVGDVAAWHEQGSPTMPRRPFLTSWYDRRGTAYLSKVTNILRKNVKHGDARRALVELGARAVTEVRAGMRALAPLAASTVERKGSSRVLRETGKLERAISAVVVVKRLATNAVASALGIAPARGGR